MPLFEDSLTLDGGLEILKHKIVLFKAFINVTGYYKCSSVN